MCANSYAFQSKYSNEYIALLLNQTIPKFAQGTVQKDAFFPNYKNNYIEIPTNHEELAKLIQQNNKLQSEVNKTTKKMEQYVQGVLQMSLKK